MFRFVRTMMLFTLFVFAGYNFAQTEAGSAELSPTLSSYTHGTPTEALWDVLYNVDLSASTGGAGNAGVVWIPSLQQFWISRWSAPAGRVYVLNAAGTAVDSFTTSGFTGTRAFTWDGEFVYAVAATNAIRKIDPVTRQTVATITTPTTITGRFISFDPTADGGNGGFWMGNWNAGALNYFLVSRTGAQLNVINNTAITGTYGIAWDGRTPGGPYLWVWSQGGGAQTPQNIIQINIATGQPTGVQHDVLTDVGIGQPTGAGIAGGLNLSTEFIPGKLALIGVLQGGPDRLFAYELGNLDAGVLQPFNLTAPAAGATIVSLPGSTTPVTVTWDTSRAGASYKWIFGVPNASNRLFTVPAGTNSMTFTLGELDEALAEGGVPPGGSLVGSWDVWAFRGNLPQNDSLKAANGPRALTLQRALPAMNAFSLVSPPNNSTVVTSVFNPGPVNINWRKSGNGVTYKWKFGTGLRGNQMLAVMLTMPANGNGFDTTLTVANSALDGALAGLGVAPGDSISGQWVVWAYNGADSLRSTEAFNLTLKRQAKGDILIAYDSTVVAARAGRDSVASWLAMNNYSFDLYNRGIQTNASSISFRGYKKVIWVGEGTSVMSVVQKDSIKAYLANPAPGTKAHLAIFAEDMGYQFGRTGSTYLDLDFFNNWLGANFVLDRPSTGGFQGLVGAHINFNMTDSTVGTWPDVLSRFDPATTHDLYKFRGDGATNAIGKVGATYNVTLFGVDIESLRRAVDSPPNGQAHHRLLAGAFAYLNTDGVVPVELTSFKSVVDGNSVKLEWTTATELNNSGFEVERKAENGEFMQIGFKAGKGTVSEPTSYTYVDNSVTSGKYSYRLKQVDFDGTFEYSPVIEVDVTAPEEFALSQNYPNPFNPSTTIKFALKVGSRVTLKIFNTLGQEVVTVVNGTLEAGIHNVAFDASQLSSGVYFYKMEAVGIDGVTFSDTKKMILTK